MKLNTFHQGNETLHQIPVCVQNGIIGTDCVCVTWESEYHRDIFEVVNDFPKKISFSNLFHLKLNVHPTVHRHKHRQTNT